MTESTEYSSQPLVLAAAGSILVTAAAGWFLLGRDAPEPIEADGAAIAQPATVAVEESAESPELAVDAAPIDVDSVLRRARLAADADMLVSPPGQNALYFYGLVVAADPARTEASAEFDAVLTRVSLIITDHLVAGEYDDAFSLAALVAGQKPGHAIVKATQETLNAHAARLLEQAFQHARDGDDEDATAVLANVQALPGLDPAYLAAAGDSIVEIQQARMQEERTRLEAERNAAEQATAEWTETVRGAIKSGRLISPTGDSAQDYLAKRDAPRETREQLAEELLAALMTAGQQSVDTGNVADAERYLAAANNLGADADGLAEMRNTLESKLIEAEGNRILGLGDFIRLNTTPAKYPRLANQLNITGWVDVEFTVTPTGATVDIEVLQAEPSNVFDESAVKAVEQWTFQPREYRGQLISQRTAARLVFRLE